MRTTYSVKPVPLVVNQDFLGFDKNAKEHIKYSGYLSALICFKEDLQIAKKKFALLKDALSCLYGKCISMTEERNLAMENSYDENKGYREVLCVPFNPVALEAMSEQRKDYCDVIREVIKVNYKPFLVNREICFYE